LPKGFEISHPGPDGEWSPDARLDARMPPWTESIASTTRLPFLRRWTPPSSFVHGRPKWPSIPRLEHFLNILG
tara:strand:- start:77 stop:295 length:219 start_codon:yes stop_codon:yes gene_type:complete